MTVNSLLLKVIPVLLLVGFAHGAVGVATPLLVPEYPFDYSGAAGRTVLTPSGTVISLRPSLMRGLLSWRLYWGGIPVGSLRSASSALLADRLLASSLTRDWRAATSSGCIRSSRDAGSLVPTIYLPLDMPPILARTIGEGGQLDISGSQRITLSGITHYRPNMIQTEGGNPSLFPDLKMEQQLQVQLNGTIGEKIHVDVDHDSEREMQPENRIRLAYEGWEDEVVQSIEVGDVSLAITGPEFVSYSIPHEGLFGAKILAQAGPVDITTIVSKEASSTESADFVGQATMVTDSILDIYPADNYFFRTCPDTVQPPVINDIRIFVDNMDATDNDETGALEGQWFTGSGDPGSGTGWWDEMLPGPDEDFILTDDSTTIQFNTPVNDNYMVAIWMVTASGDTVGSAPPGSMNLLLIKESNPLPSYATWNYEMRNRYFLGSNNIVQNSFDCDIYLSRSGEEAVSTQDGTPFIQLLGLDTNGDGSLADEEGVVDWDNGFLEFPDPRPFTSDSLAEKNPLIYTERNPEPTDSKYFLAVSFRAASTTYSLGNMGIVPGSESVILTVAGVPEILTRDVDYTIIYEIGLLTLMGEAAEDAQDPSNTLRVTYEYLPFLSAQQRTLFGTRAVYNLGESSWLGATAMYESSSNGEDRPRVGEESTRTFVTDVDAHYETHPEFLTDLANAVPGINTEAQSRFLLSGEVAASFPDPNTSNKAFVDDMEGTEQSFYVGQERTAWRSGSSPVATPPLLSPPGYTKWYNVTDRWRLDDIVEGALGEQADDFVRSVLELCFDPLQGSMSSWGSIQRCIDPYGLDFSTKTTIRLYVRATGSAQDASLYLDLGERIDEDSYWLERVSGQLVMRANNTLDTEDADNNGQLSDGEDTGLDNLFSEDEDPGSGNPDPNRDDYFFDSSLPPIERFRGVNGTEDNGMLNTEDLNRNGLLDRYNSFFRIRIPLNDPAYVLSEHEGWMLIEIPLSDSLLVEVPGISESDPTWEKISYARLWVEGFTQPDTIDVYDFRIIGNRWEPRPIGLVDSIGPSVSPWEDLVVSTVNNQDNPDYTADPPPGINPGKDENGDLRLEQSLMLQAVSVEPAHEGRARQIYYNSEDYTGYSTMSFPVHGEPTAAGEFFLRMGRDSLNYYEIITPLQPGWQVVRTELEDLTRLKEQKNERGLTYLRAGNLAAMGNPNLAEVQELCVGVRNNTASQLGTIVWVDDITLSGAFSDVDIARRVTTAIDIADFANITGDYRAIGADFHGLGQSSGQGSNTTRFASGLKLNLDRLAPPLWSISLPATLAWNRQISEPRFRPSSDLRLSEDESWFYRTQSDVWDTSIGLRRTRRSDDFLHRYLVDPWELSHAYSNGTGLSPSYRDSTNSARGEITYDLPLGEQPLFSLPIIGGGTLRPTHTNFSVSRQNAWDTRWELADDDTTQTRASRSRTLGTQGSLTFALYRGFSASIGMGVTRDLLYPWQGDASFNVGREISRNQTLSASQDINLWSYLFPRVSYDAAYGSNRLAPHTSSGEDSLGSPDISLSTTRRLNLRVGLVQLIRSLARLRDERLDETASAGSPRWMLVKLERWANNITDPTVMISRTLGSEYDALGFYPGYSYRFGLETELEGVEAYDRSRTDNVQVSGGFRPVQTLSVRTEYSTSDNRHFYSGYWNRQKTRTWPSVTVSWSGLERLAPLARLLRTGSLNTGYRIETSESGRFEDEEYIPTSRTTTNRWTPLFNITASLKNKVQISISDNYSLAETHNYTGSQARTKTSNSSFQVNLQYAFSAPGGLAIPLPLLDKLRVSFQSDLTTGLAITRSRTRTEIIAPGYEDQLQSDREEWRIEPSANYDFGTVTAGLTAIYGWKKDRVNSIYDQRDVGMDIWVMLNF